AIMRNSMRAWADQRHVADDDVEQLRQLIDARLTEPASKARHAWIVARRLGNDIPVLKHLHGPKFVNDKCVAVETIALLFKYYRPIGLNLEQQGGHQHQR